MVREKRREDREGIEKRILTDDRKKEDRKNEERDNREEKEIENRKSEQEY